MSKGSDSRKQRVWSENSYELGGVGRQGVQPVGKGDVPSGGVRP